MSKKIYLAHVCGETFSWSFKLVMPVGNWAITSHLRNASGDLIKAFLVTVIPPVLGETESVINLVCAAAESKLWPVDSSLYFDVKFTNTITSETFFIPNASAGPVEVLTSAAVTHD